jgi:hypothetical protein
MAHVLALLAVVLLAPARGGAAEWGRIEPGVTTVEQVRSRYGPPTKQAQLKVEGYDTSQWVYEPGQAPPGLVRMTVDFGLLTPDGYKPSLVRLLKLEPKPLVFGRSTVLEGWGVPDGVSRQEGLLTFFYKAGLLVVFDKEGASATSMLFSPPQPDAPTSVSPPKP